MVDVTPPLPLPPPREPPSKKQEKTVDADKFHEEMHRRVQRVSETDEEQKKKRKHKQEAEEEEEPTEAAGAPTTPPGQVTPFSLAQEKKKVSPLDMQKGEQISPLASAQPTGKPIAPTPPPSPFTTAPSTDEMEDDSGLLEESAFIETTPVEEEPLSSTAPQTPYVSEETPPTPSPPAPQEVSAAPQEASPPTPPPFGRVETPTPETPKPAPKKPEEQPLEGEKKKKGKAIAAGPPSPAAPKKAAPTGAPPKPAAAQTIPSKPLPPPTEAKKEGITTEEIEKMQAARTEETTGFFEQYVEDKEKSAKREISPKEIAEEKAEVEGIAPIAPLLPSDYIEKEKKEEKEIAAASGAGGPLGGLQAGLPPPAIEPPAPINPYANLRADVMDLFDRMVGTMTVMSLSGITETVVTLDAPKFASSVFFGSQIIIQEYSSAPQAFNIQLNGSPEAIALFQGNADDLMAAFQYGNYNFRVNRLETGLLGQKPLIKRKGPPSGGKEDQRGSKR